MFSFRVAEGLGKDDIENISIIYSPLIWNSERYKVIDITELLNKNFIDSLQIAHIFITDYSFEIVSSNSNIFDYGTLS